jgi:hypothetical protein
MAATTYVYDTFTGANGTSLDAHPPDVDVVGSGWVERNGQWTLSSNRLVPTGADPGDYYCTIDSGQADVVISAEMTPDSTGRVMQFLVRYTNNSNMWRIQFSSGSLAIYEVNGGTFTLRASASPSMAAGRTYVFRIVANGTTISASVAGTTISYSSASHNLTATSHGFGMNAIGGSFDNYRVTSVEETPDYYALSEPTVLFTGGAPKTYHTFQPVHMYSDILEVNLGGYKYWAYYTLANGGPFTVHLARSNDLVTWDDYGYLFNGRWPSVTFDGTTFHAFYGTGTDDYVMYRATSTDGITFTYQETVASGNANNAFLWRDPADDRWHIFHHAQATSGLHEIRVKSASTLTGLAAAPITPLLQELRVLASPGVHYRDGHYWMLVESYPSSIWNTEVYVADRVEGPWVKCPTNPLLSNNDACAMPFHVDDALYVYYSELTNVGSNYWDIVQRTYNLPEPPADETQPRHGLVMLGGFGMV